MFYNPFFRKFEIASLGEKPSTYTGIGAKALWFLIFTFIGVASYFFMPSFTNNMALLISSIALAVICPIIIYLVPSTAPVLGTLYSLIQGYTVAIVCVHYTSNYSNLVSIALSITAIVFFSLLFLYSSGIIKVGNKFKAIVATLFLSSFFASGVAFISSLFFPLVKELIFGNGILSLIIAVISLLIAAFNLIIEFDNISLTVENRLRKKYEWQAAFGLIMTVIFLFLRILEVLSKFIGKDKEND